MKTTTQRTHQLLVHFPIALWVGSFALDIVAAISGTSHEVAYYLAIAGCVAALGAAGIGLFEMTLRQTRLTTKVRTIAMNHSAATLVALLLWLGSITLRGSPDAMPAIAWFASIWGVLLVIVADGMGTQLVQALGHTSHRHAQSTRYMA